MSIGSYFVSEEAENAATRQIIESFKQAKEAKAKLEGQMSVLGDRLANSGRVLKRPGEYSFLVNRADITVGHPSEMGNPPRRPVVRVEADDLKWESVMEMVSSYDRARSAKAESAARLRNMGLDIAE